MGFSARAGATKWMCDYRPQRPATDVLDLETIERRRGELGQLSLRQLTEEHTGLVLPRPKTVALSNWEAASLADSQVRYAASEALAAFLVFDRLRQGSRAGSDGGNNGPPKSPPAERAAARSQLELHRLTYRLLYCNKSLESMGNPSEQVARGSALAT